MLKSFTFPTAPSECVEPVSTGSSLVSKTACYNIVSLLGRGAFGNVVKCVRISDMKTVAVKMIKNEEPYNLCVKHEYAALSMLKQLDQDKCNIVRWNHIFMDKGYICLEFERLHTSLHDFMGARVKPLSLCEIRPIIQQVAIALLHLQGIGLMHADLKLENIMLVNHPKDPYKVKVIDFGLAVKLSDATVGTYTQSRYYRSPEVLLGLPLTTAIDVWSLGCVTAYLYLGWPLHCGSTEYNMLQSIVETHGALPKNMIQKGVKTSTFFWWNVKTKCWTFKNPEQYQKDSKKEQIPEDLRKIRFPNLDALINFKPFKFKQGCDKVAEVSDRRTFVTIIKGMLSPDPNVRITPRKLLQHDFFSLTHLDNFKKSTYVQSAMSLMGSHLHNNLAKQLKDYPQPTKPQRPTTSQRYTSNIRPSENKHMPPKSNPSTIKREHGHIVPTVEQAKSRLVGQKRVWQNSLELFTSDRAKEEWRRAILYPPGTSIMNGEHKLNYVPHPTSKLTLDQTNSKLAVQKKVRQSSPGTCTNNNQMRVRANTPGPSTMKREQKSNRVPHQGSNSTKDQTNSTLVVQKKVRQSSPGTCTDNQKRACANSFVPSTMKREQKTNCVPHHGSTIEQTKSRLVGQKRVSENPLELCTSGSSNEEWKRVKLHTPGTSIMHREQERNSVPHSTSNLTMDKTNSRLVDQKSVKQSSHGTCTDKNQKRSGAKSPGPSTMKREQSVPPQGSTMEQTNSRLVGQRWVRQNSPGICTSVSNDKERQLKNQWREQRLLNLKPKSSVQDSHTKRHSQVQSAMKQVTS